LTHSKNKDIEVIVADDGSTDGTKEWMKEQDIINAAYFHCGPNKGFRAGRARNFAAANANGSLLVFIDSDVILTPDALVHFAEAHEKHPKAVILGLYHWLPPMQFDYKTVLDPVRFWDIVLMNFPKLPYEGSPGLQGKDLRYHNFSDDIGVLVDNAALGCFSGNIGYPKTVFDAVGGFDEAINRHGGEDADLGLTVQEAGYRFLLYKSIVGYHIWHWRNQEQNAIDVQYNIGYIDRKHGVGTYAKAQEWDDLPEPEASSYYRKDEKDNKLVCDPGGTYWVIRGKYRKGISTPDMLTSLGWAFPDADPISVDWLKRYEPV